MLVVERARQQLITLGLKDAAEVLDARLEQAAKGEVTYADFLLDRLLHHSHVINIRGESYRLREKRRSGLLRSIVESEQEA